MNLSREQTIIMRGLAIILIALHNFSHWMDFAISENESTFSADNVSLFFNQIGCFSEEWVINLFSFLGWYGVPVFIFLTAFGLVRKYESGSPKMKSRWAFVYKNWVKFFALFLPAVLVFICLDIINWDYSYSTYHLFARIARRLFSLTFLNDILFCWEPVNPFIYWYFGLTLEFYILYAFAVYKKPVWLLLILTLGSLILQHFVLPGAWNNFSDVDIRWVRANITGWMLPFAFGIIFARTRNFTRTATYVIVGLAIILFAPTMFNPDLWHISLLCAVVLAIVFAKLSDKIPYWRTLWIWLGKMSPFIFVAHPIVRALIFTYCPSFVSPHLYVLTVYFVAVILMSIAYRFIWEKLTPLLKRLFYPQGDGV